MSHFFIISILSALLSALAFDNNEAITLLSYSNSNEEHTIPMLLENSSVDSNSPRSPSLVPILCVLDDELNILRFNFIDNIGEIRIILMKDNFVAYRGDFHSLSRLVYVPIPERGTYEIIIHLESGTVYLGNFTY